MKLDELILLFPSRNAIADQALMIGPADLRRLEGREISGSRMFLMVLAGCMEVRIDGSPSVLCPCSFVDMFEKTTFFVERIAPDCEAYCILPTKEFVRRALMAFRVGDDRHLFNSMKFPVLRISADEAHVLERPLKLLNDSVLNAASHYRAELSQVYFRAFLIEFADVLFRLSDSCDEGAGLFTRKDGLFMDFMKLVWQHACRERRIDFYADQLSITPKHLTRIIREKLSDTPHEVIAKEVVHHAIEMLRQEDFSVQQIASRLNFPDQASFCKFFKTHTAQSPTEYRKKVCAMA